MKKITTGLSTVLLALFMLVPAAKADSYDGPFCFESADTSSPPSQGVEDKTKIRGTCKEIQFERVFTIDSGIQNYVFLPKEGAATTTGPLTLRSGDGNDPAIRYEAIDDSEFGDGSYYVIGRPIYLVTMASDNSLGTTDLADTNIKFVDQYNRPKDSNEDAFTSYYKGRGGIYVPITNPVTKIVEHWHITKKPNGFMLVRDKTDLYLDDGTVKTTLNTSGTDSPSEPVVSESWWSRFIGFFKNLF